MPPTRVLFINYNDVIMSMMASRITSLTIVYSTVPKFRVTGPCARNSPVTGEFPAQRASNAENVYIWWRHHEVGHSKTYVWHLPQRSWVNLGAFWFLFYQVNSCHCCLKSSLKGHGKVIKFHSQISVWTMIISVIKAQSTSTGRSSQWPVTQSDMAIIT